MTINCSANSLILILFAFSDNLSAENSKLSWHRGHHPLGCMKVSFTKSKYCSFTAELQTREGWHMCRFQCKIISNVCAWAFLVFFFVCHFASWWQLQTKTAKLCLCSTSVVFPRCCHCFQPLCRFHNSPLFFTVASFVAFPFLTLFFLFGCLLLPVWYGIILWH